MIKDEIDNENETEEVNNKEEEKEKSGGKFSFLHLIFVFILFFLFIFLFLAITTEEEIRKEDYRYINRTYNDLKNAESIAKDNDIKIKIAVWNIDNNIIDYSYGYYNKDEMKSIIKFINDIAKSDNKITYSEEAELAKFIYNIDKPRNDIEYNNLKNNLIGK